VTVSDLYVSSLHGATCKPSLTSIRRVAGADLSAREGAVTGQGRHNPAVEFHRNHRIVLHVAGWFILAVQCALSPWLLSLIGHEYLFGDWVGYVMALLGAAAAGVLLPRAKSRFFVRVDPDGVRFSRGRETIGLAWEQIARIEVTHTPAYPRRPRASLLMGHHLPGNPGPAPRQRTAATASVAARGTAANSGSHRFLG
jgi:hypothetical protein